MNAILGNQPVTMSSDEIADVCNARHNDVVETIERLFEKGVLRESRKTTRRVKPAGGGRPKDVYDLTKRDSLVVVSGYDDEVRAKLIDRWIELETRATAARPLTTAETLLQMLQMQVDAERRQEEQSRAITAVEHRVDLIEATAPLTAKPQNTETLSDVRHRINRKYGLPPRIVDFVLMKITYKIRPFAMVKNSHENAEGSSFAVYHSIDVTNLFKRFVRECTQVTATMATHPEIEGRFKLVKGSSR